MWINIIYIFEITFLNLQNNNSPLLIMKSSIIVIKPTENFKILASKALVFSKETTVLQILYL
jgi:hypothetical protein